MDLSHCQTGLYKVCLRLYLHLHYIRIILISHMTHSAITRLMDSLSFNKHSGNVLVGRSYLVSWYFTVTSTLISRFLQTEATIAPISECQADNVQVPHPKNPGVSNFMATWKKLLVRPVRSTVNYSAKFPVYQQGVPPPSWAEMHKSLSCTSFWRHLSRPG